MIVVRSVEGLHREVGATSGSQSLGYVPTMGSIHEGHASLIAAAREQADRVAVSIFVNPLQFGPAEDFEEYPRDEESDLEKLEAADVDLAFLPSLEELLPGGTPRVTVDPGEMNDVLCGPHRPGHFRGVLTIVARLFGLVRPDIAMFGRKDFQQSVLVRRMVQDLALGVRVVTVPTVREADGLALSSRNAYLSAEERAQAPALYEALEAARERVGHGEGDVEALLSGIRARLERAPSIRVQYAEIVDESTLERLRSVSTEAGSRRAVAGVAAFCGETRLIDNVTLNG